LLQAKSVALLSKAGLFYQRSGEMLLNIILVIALGICFITDLKQQRIYNKVIFPAIIIALVLHLTASGFNGLKLSLLGFIAGLAVLIIPYFLGGIGAGDVKLLATIGAIKGSFFVFNTALYMAVIGGIIAFIIIVSNGALLNVLKQLRMWMYSLLCGIKYKLEFPTSTFLKKYPYGVAIVGGAVICLIFKEAWII
jgi:prepilin peptidase CpaA